MRMRKFFNVIFKYSILCLCNSLEEVHSSLQKEGFSRVESVSAFDGYTYCLDTHCEDVLIFPCVLKEQLLTLDLFINYKLILQVS